MTIELKIAGEKEAEEWDRLVESSPHGTIFHTWKWLKIAEKHTQKRILGQESRGVLYPLVGFRGTTPVGIFPLFYYKNLFFRSVFSPPPGVEILYLGPVLADYEKLKQSKKESNLLKFQNEVDKFIISRLKPNWILMHLSPGIMDSRPFKWTGYEVEPRYTYLINLSEGIDYVWGQFHSKLRKSIKKAIKSDIYVEEGSQGALEFIYKSLVARRKEQRTPITSSIEYLIEVYNTFPSNLKILVAKQDEKYISGIINVCYKDKVAFWIGAPKVSKGISPNELLLWESIKWAYNHGFKYYEVVGADDPKLYTFKTKYNGDLVTFLSCRKYSPSIIKLLETVYRSIKPRHRI